MNMDIRSSNNQKREETNETVSVLKDFIVALFVVIFDTKKG